MTGSGMNRLLAAMSLLDRSDLSPVMRIDLRDDIFDSPFERLQTLKRVLVKRPRDRVRKGIAAPGPTSKRATVKAARRANVRRLAK